MAYDFEKERNEAIAAGERALTSLRAAREELRSAGNWGLVDLFGGGMISGLVKHSKMGNAQRYMEQAKLDLQSFSRELQDVNMTHNLNLNVGDFLTFADFFFDGGRCHSSGGGYRKTFAYTVVYRVYGGIFSGMEDTDGILDEFSIK